MRCCVASPFCKNIKSFCSHCSSKRLGIRNGISGVCFTIFSEFSEGDYLTSNMMQSIDEQTPGKSRCSISRWNFLIITVRQQNHLVDPKVLWLEPSMMPALRADLGTVLRQSKPRTWAPSYIMCAPTSWAVSAISRNGVGNKKTDVLNRRAQVRPQPRHRPHRHPAPCDLHPKDRL